MPVGSDLGDVTFVTGSGAYYSSYTWEEYHTFLDVPYEPDASNITILQNGSPLSVEPLLDYDPEGQSLTVSFPCSAYSGTSSTTQVTLELEDGTSDPSTNFVTAPDLTGSSLSVTSNGDGTCTFDISIQAISPVPGELYFDALLWPSESGDAVAITPVQVADGLYTCSVTLPVADSGTQVASIDVYGYWSMAAYPPDAYDIHNTWATAEYTP